MHPSVTMVEVRDASYLSPEDFRISATMPDDPAALPILELFTASFTTFSVICTELYGRSEHRVYSQQPF